MLELLHHPQRRIILKYGLLVAVSYFFVGVSQGSFALFQQGMDSLINFCFTLFCVATSWWLFKKMYAFWLTDNKLNLFRRLLFSVIVSLLLCVYISALNWVYIELLWNENLGNTLYFPVVLPLALVLFLAWCVSYFLINKPDSRDAEAPSTPKILHFSVKKGRNIHCIPVDDALGFVIENGVVFLVSRDGKRFIVDQSMNDLEKLLGDRGFFRVNRQFLVVQSAVVSYQSIENEKLTVELHSLFVHSEPCMVSRYKAASFKRWLHS